MIRKEAVDVLEAIKELYPKFEVTKRKVSILIPQLEQMDYQLVMNNLAVYVAKHPFPPTIAEIAAYPTVEADYVSKVKGWSEEAAIVPQELKMRFRDELIQLVMEKSGYENR